MCNWWCYRSSLPINFWELTKWWFLLVVFIDVVVHISQLLFLFITFYLEAKSTKEDGKDIELETRNSGENNQEEEETKNEEEEEMESEITNPSSSSSSSPSVAQYKKINTWLSVLNMISNLSVIIFLTIYLLLPSAVEWLPHYSVAIIISFFWMFSFFFIFVLPPVKYQSHIEYFKSNKHFHYSELSLFHQWKETINEFGRTYYLSYLSQLSQSFHRNKVIIVLISLFSLILFSFLLSFSVSGLCITIEPTTISTRLTRMMNEDVCDKKTGICHLYLLLPADDSIHNMKVILHTNIEPTMLIIEYGSDPSLSSSANGIYTYMRDIKEVDRFVSSFFLTGLMSDTVYYFRVRYDDQDDHVSDVRMFKTLTNNSSFSFIAGGDIGATNTSSLMAKLAGKEEPSFVTFGGDIAYENGFPACYQRYDDVLSLLETNLITPNQLMIPLAFGIGNHDVSGELSIYPHSASQSPFFFDYFPHYPPSLTPPIKEQEAYHYHIIGERSMLIILDSNHCNSPSGDQAIWLEQVLIKNKNYTVFTQYHVPMYPCNTPYNDTVSIMLRDAWVPLFDSYGVAVSLENHGHTYKRTFPLYNNTVSGEGTVYIGDGAFGVYPMYPPVPFNGTIDWWLNFTTPANNFIQLTVEEGTIRMAAKTSDGSVLDHSDIPFYDIQ